MAQNNSLIVKSDYASRPSVPVGQKLNGIEINELGDFQKVQGVNQGAFDNTGVLIDGTGSYNNISYDQPTLTITILSSVATSGNNSKTVQMTFVQECTLSFTGAIGLTIGIPQGNVIIPGTYIFTFQHDPINSKVNFINFRGTTFQLLNGSGTSIRDNNKVDLGGNNLTGNTTIRRVIGAATTAVKWDAQMMLYFQEGSITTAVFADAQLAILQALDGTNAATIYASHDGIVRVGNNGSGIFKGLKYRSNVVDGDIDWTGEELLIPHQKRVLELIAESPDSVANTTHRTGDGNDHSGVNSNTTHRNGSGSDHSDVAINNAKRTYPSADETKLGTIEENAKDHIPPVHLADYADEADMVLPANQVDQIVGHPYKTLDTESWWYLRTKGTGIAGYDGGGVVVEKMTLPCGPLDVAAIVGRVYTIVADENYTIQSLYPFVDVAPSGGPITMDIRINGTSILSTLINILDGQTLSDGNHVISTSTWSIGQKLEVFVTVNNGAEFPQITMTATI